MKPKLIGNPLLAWRDESTLQIGWGAHALVVQNAPEALPDWVRCVDGRRSEAEIVAEAEGWGMDQTQARRLLSALREAGLLVRRGALRLSIQSRGLVHEPLATALRAAGVQVVPGCEVVVLPLGQLPALTNAPSVRRLIPVWFSGEAVHVGPVLDEEAGPCPRCIDLASRDLDPRWPHLAAQAGSMGLWGHPAQLVQAAAAITVVAQSARAIGLETIVDPGTAGPCWRVWSVHPDCPCQRA